jgi:hexosaminidase
MVHRREIVRRFAALVPRTAPAVLRALALVTAFGLAVPARVARAQNAAAMAAPALSIIPLPVTMTAGSGHFTVGASTTIWADKAFLAVATQFARTLWPATGLDLVVKTGTKTGSNRIVFKRDGKLLASLGAEGYRLEVKPQSVTIVAAEPAGAFYAVQTMRQLLPPENFRGAVVAGVAWTMPSVTIEDRPRFVWRGAHLDVSRHFMPKEFVKKYIDLLAMHKMNTFHWHLTDDQGWRIEIKKYPRLTEVGAWRTKTLVGRAQRDTANSVFDNKPHGGYYTQADIREIVAYASARFITIVPEIEMPGHAQEVVSAYPWLGNIGDQIAVRTTWGVSDHILRPSDSTITFMQDVLTEVLAIFPGTFIHVGGDEASKTQWKASAFVQERIRELGLKDENELQSWFIKQMDTFLTAHGRRLIGWDEILDGGLAPNAAVMSWRGTDGGIAAARQQHDVVMTPGSYTYFDHYQSRPTNLEPLAWGGYLPIDTVYSYDPVPAQLEPEFAKHILGTQAQLWSEYMENPKQVEYMAYPRMCALAEVTWTPVARKNFGDFMTRLTGHLPRLDALDVNYRGSRRP